MPTSPKYKVRPGRVPVVGEQEVSPVRPQQVVGPEQVRQVGAQLWGLLWRRRGAGQQVEEKWRKRYKTARHDGGREINGGKEERCRISWKCQHYKYSSRRHFWGWRWLGGVCPVIAKRGTKCKNTVASVTTSFPCALFVYSLKVTRGTRNNQQQQLSDRLYPTTSSI